MSHVPLFYWKNWINEDGRGGGKGGSPFQGIQVLKIHKNKFVHF